MKKFIALFMVLALIFTLPVMASAKKSPNGVVEIKVTVIQTNGGNAVGEENDDETYTVTATPNDGYEFVGWTIEGEYTILDGSLTSKELTFDYTTDITVTPIWKPIGTSEPSGPVDSGSGSPTTSDNTGNVLPIAIASLIAVLTLAGYAIIRNKHVTQ
ncbi:MAG: hypothetical protein IJE65_01585 [Clostridia bacterium]|nr:hypothetical protein [Clostridia bacterium]